MKSNIKMHGKPITMSNATTSKTTMPKSTMSAEKKQAMLNELTQQFTSYHLNMEEAMASDKPIKFVMSQTGMVEIRENEVATFKVQPKSIPGAPKVQQGFEMKLPKIPYALYQQTIAFFRGICEKMNNDEAAVQLYWNKKKEEYFIHVPIQEVSGASVNFTRDEAVESDKDCLLVMDIHSHNTMKAYFSGVDDNDEKETRLFGVIGELDEEHPSHAFRAVCGGTPIELSIWDVFENPLQNVEVPDDWYNRVTKKKYQTLAKMPHGYTNRYKGFFERDENDSFGQQEFYSYQHLNQQLDDDDETEFDSVDSYGLDNDLMIHDLNMMIETFSDEQIMAILALVYSNHEEVTKKFLHQDNLKEAQSALDEILTEYV